MWSPCLNMVKTFLGKSKCNEPFRFQVKLCATAPLCNILMVSFYLPFFAVKIVCAHILPHAHLASGGRVRCLCLNRAAKSKDLSSDTWARPTSVTSTKSSGLRVSLPKSRHLTKGPWYLLSSRDTHEETYERTCKKQPVCSYLWVFL